VWGKVAKMRKKLNPKPEISPYPTQNSITRGEREWEPEKEKRNGGGKENDAKEWKEKVPKSFLSIGSDLWVGGGNTEKKGDL